MLWELLPVLYVPYLRGIGVQITKQQLKQIIKEEIRAVQLEALRGRDARNLIGKISSAIEAQGHEVARDYIEQMLELYSAEDDASLYIVKEQDFLEVVPGSLQWEHMPRKSWPWQTLFTIGIEKPEDQDVLDALALEIQSNAEFYDWKFQATPVGSQLLLKVLT